MFQIGEFCIDVSTTYFLLIGSFHSQLSQSDLQKKKKKNSQHYKRVLWVLLSQFLSRQL